MEGFRCERCISCTNCGRNTAGQSRLSKWSKDFKLCSSCNKKRNKKHFCLVCERIIGTVDPETNETRNEGALIECECGHWTHQSCDLELTDDLFKMYESGQAENLYECPVCRKEKRRDRLLAFFETYICKEDIFGFFYRDVRNELPNYSLVVREPMCLQQV